LQRNRRTPLADNLLKGIDMAAIKHPFHPIIYVRGYAMTRAEIAATVATPYMGFNLGATKIRQDWQGKVHPHIFESALIRLMKDHKYSDVYSDGKAITGDMPARSVVIYRYYDQADADLGSGKVPSIIDAANGLSELILNIRKQVCADDPQRLADFKVYLVAHSMGGLVCRCFLQNDSVGDPQARAMVDKVFTYATPHNGIDVAGVNVPDFFNVWDMDNFNRKEMAKYLGLSGQPERVDTLNNRFDPNRFFCLVGTNCNDYDVAGGLTGKMVGEMSDGLVRIENATVAGAPRAFVYRSHSGPYGIVNSEEGYQNLTRFLFGNVRVDGILEVENLPLPPSIQDALDAGKDLKASYFFESTVVPRGAVAFKLTERRKETHSAIFRKFDQMMKVEKVAGLDTPRSPYLFSVFLDTKKITTGRTIVFSVEVIVSSTDYMIDGVLFFDKYVEGENLFRNTITLRATIDDDSWNVRYVMSDDNWSENRGRDVEEDDSGWYVPLSSPKGFKGKLRLGYRSWS
tara:strand:+ start:4269 stop:5813 length:1545 start_codon:yes stop_codon:yes gene_type:complete